MEKSDVKNIIILAAELIVYIGLIVLFRFIEVNKYVQLAAYISLYIIIGHEHIIGAIKEFIEEPFNEDFLMLVASIGAFCLGEFAEAVAVILLFSIGEFFEEFAEERSKNSITELAKMIPENANLLVGGKEVVTPISDIKPGDYILLRAGDVAPCDGCLVNGFAEVDNSALTGESLPISLKTGDFISSGGVVTNGMITIKATKIAKESASGKILELVKDTEEKKPAQEKFIKKFAKIYTPTVIALALIVAVVPPIFLGDFPKWIQRGLNFLVISCPCALVISVPMAFFAGLGKAFSKGILVKGGVALEKMSKINLVAFDKTGTLTEGNLKVKQVFVHNNICTEKDLLKCAAVCEKGSNHPIAKAVLSAAGDVDISGYNITETAGMGVCAYNEKVRLYVGKREFLQENGITVIDEVKSFDTCVYVAENDKYIGKIVIGDTMRSSAKNSIDLLKKNGMTTVMLTGDNQSAAEAIAKEVGVDEVHAGLMPENKIELLSGRQDKVCAFVGDGINDAPVLTGADVGIAMGSGTNVAIECADVIIQDNNLAKVPMLKRIAKRTMSVVYTNIVAAIAIKIAVLVLSVTIGVPIWLAIFADVGVMVLAILNSLRLSL